MSALDVYSEHCWCLVVTSDWLCKDRWHQVQVISQQANPCRQVFRKHLLSLEVLDLPMVREVCRFGICA